MDFSDSFSMTTENRDNDASLPPVPPAYGGTAPGYSAPQVPLAPKADAAPPIYAPPAPNYAPPPVNQGYYAAPGYGVKEPNAVLAFVMGLLGFFVLGPLAIVAVIMGRKSLNAIKENPSLEGKNMALAGYIIGWVSIGFWILGLIFVFIVLGLASVGIDSGPSYQDF